MDSVIMSLSLKGTDQHLQTSVQALPVLASEILLKNSSARQIQCTFSSTLTTVLTVKAGGLFGVSATLLCFFSNQLKYFSEAVGVEGEGTLSKFGVLTSPNYPRLYPNSHDSTQEIRVAEGKTIKMRFTDFSTEAEYDYVEINNGDGEPPIAVESGSWEGPEYIVTSTNNVFVKFHTDGDTRRNGWRLEWTERKLENG